MENSALISVVIPAYNAEEYISQCIENLLCQTYKYLEIIVVDDGSTDNTPRIVKGYKTVKYVYQENSGVSVARNRGIEVATGEYIHFMDADDLINVEFYEKMLQAIVETQSDMACCGFIFERFPAQSQQITSKLVTTRTEDKILMTNVCNYGACWKYLIRSSFLKEKNLQFEPDISVGEDRMFSIQAVYFAGKIVSVPNAVYVYKNRENSVTVSKNREIIKRRHTDRKKAEQFLLNFAQQHNFTLDRSLQEQRVQYKLLGLPVFSKKIFHPGKVRWYIFNIPIFQKKEVDK